MLLLRLVFTMHIADQSNKPSTLKNEGVFISGGGPKHRGRRLTIGVLEVCLSVHVVCLYKQVICDHGGQK